MVSAGYYRTEADRCRKLADAAKDADVAQQWRKMARDYSALADELEGSHLLPPQAMHVPMQQQPMQQPQAKTEPEDKE